MVVLLLIVLMMMMVVVVVVVVIHSEFRWRGEGGKKAKESRYGYFNSVQR
jgi:preprotein translocase subunit SecG